MVDENKEVQTQSAATAEAPVAESTSATPAHATEITSTLDGTHSVDPADAGPGGPADEVGDGEEKKDEVADVVSDPEPDPEPPAPAAAAVPPAADPAPVVSKDLAEAHELPKVEEPKPVIKESPSTDDLDSIGTAQDTGTFEDGKLIQPGVNGANLGPRGEGGVPLDAIVPDKRPVATVTKNTVTDNIDSAGNDQGVHAPIGPRGVGRAPDSYRQ